MKCICIDPPYNTANEGWAYNDNVNSPAIKKWLGETVGKEGETLDRHDRWLCMMYPRLALLREFLSEDGRVFVFLDDNEIQALRYVMDEVFGANNFITTAIWQKMDGPRNTARHFSEDHDYVAVYAKRSDLWRPNKLLRHFVGVGFADVAVGGEDELAAVQVTLPVGNHLDVNSQLDATGDEHATKRALAVGGQSEALDDGFLALPGAGLLVLDGREEAGAELFDCHPPRGVVEAGKAALEVGELALGEGLVGGFEGLAFLLAVVLQERIVNAIR